MMSAGALALFAGAGFGAGLQGAIKTVVPNAERHERSGMLAVAFVVSYLALGLPAVVAGFLIGHGPGLDVTAQRFGAVVMALAVFAFMSMHPLRTSSARG